MIELRIVAFGSPTYHQAVELRRRILRLPLGLDFAERELDEEGNDVHFVAEADGLVVGVLILVPQADMTIKMRQVAVEPDFQGQGIGRRLVAESEVWARRGGYSQMELHAREEAVGFYSQLGYGIEGGTFEEVTLPHRRMVKDLTGRPA